MNRRLGHLFALVVGVGFASARTDALADEPPYPHGSFRADCKICHQGSSWRPAHAGPEFDHTAFGFALTGAHAGVECLACHTSLAFDASRGTACKECHDDVHAGTMGTDCGRCHTTRSFVDRANEIRAHVLTRFPLTGAHLSVDCESCHSSTGSGQLVFTATSTECFSCHRAEYQSTTSPAHAVSGFSTDCSGCHSTYAWSGVTNFDHAFTGFPLTGAHRTVECAACHGPSSAGHFAAVDPACVACHRAEYDGATDPLHAASGFGVDCVQCHSTTSWSGASFDHARTGFALTGAHAPLQCLQCHGDGVYTGRDPACVACHRTDYDGTTAPNHATSGFGLDCASCHSTAAWEGAAFDHDARFFPIYSGRHRNEWTSCADCHTNPTNYAVFNCLGCHPHSNRADTDDHHRGENGYQYESNACYSCHPDGRQ